MCRLWGPKETTSHPPSACAVTAGSPFNFVSGEALKGYEQSTQGHASGRLPETEIGPETKLQRAQRLELLIAGEMEEAHTS